MNCGANLLWQWANYSAKLISQFIMDRRAAHCQWSNCPVMHPCIWLDHLWMNTSMATSIYIYIEMIWKCGSPHARIFWAHPLLWSEEKRSGPMAYIHTALQHPSLYKVRSLCEYDVSMSTWNEIWILWGATNICVVLIYMFLIRKTFISIPF